MSPIKCIAAGFLLAAATSASAVSVDVTSTKGITIGGAIGGAGGKFVPWGGSVVLDEKDAFIRANGRCAFNVMYDMQNNGDSTTAGFKNTLVAKDAVVAINGPLTLTAGQSKNISTQPYLVPGTYGFGLKLDSENALAESNETNNAFSVKVTLNGKCNAAETPPPPPPPGPLPDLTPVNGIAVGGRSVTWGGTVELSRSNAMLVANGSCAFAVMFDVANTGTQAAGAFSNVLVVGSRVLAQLDGVTLGAGQTKRLSTQVYLAPGTNVLRLLMDMNRNVTESNEANNIGEVTVKVGECR